MEGNIIEKIFKQYLQEIEKIESRRNLRKGLREGKFKDCAGMAKYYGWKIGSLVDVVDEDGSKEGGWKILAFFDPQKLNDIRDVDLGMSMKERVKVYLSKDEKEKEVFFKDLLNWNSIILKESDSSTELTKI